MRFFCTILALGGLVLPCLGQSSGTQGISFVESGSYNVSHGDFAKVTRGGFRMMAVDSVEGLPGCRQVLSSIGGIVYLSATGQVIASVIAGEREWIRTSSDGSRISRLSWSEDLDEPLVLKVESADGRLLWRRDDGYGRGETAYSGVHVTSSGYAVVTPNIPPPELEGLTNVRGNLESPLILDNKGQLVAKLPVVTRRAKCFDALSPEGDYYAINFIGTVSDVVADTVGGLNCLALFEVRTGRELWRHYFGHSGYGRVAIGPEARAVVSAGQDKAPIDGHAANGKVVYFFNRQGHVVGKRQMFDDVRHLTLSPDGKLAAMASYGDVVGTRTIERQVGDGPVETVTVRVRYDSVFVFDTATGSLIHSLAPKPVYSSDVGVLTIANNGNLLAMSTFVGGAKLRRKYATAQLIDLEGVIAWERRFEMEGDNKVKYALAGNGRRMFEVGSRGTVVVYDQY